MWECWGQFEGKFEGKQRGLRPRLVMSCILGMMENWKPMEERLKRSFGSSEKRGVRNLN